MSEIIDMPGTEGMKICRKCGAIKVDGECPECTIAGQAESMADAIQQAEKDEKVRRRAVGLDVYKILETQGRLVKKRQRQIQKLLNAGERALDEHSDDPFMVERVAKAMATLDRSMMTIGSTLPKIAKEMLSFQTARSKIVNQMSMDEQVAQIVRWFSRLPGARQLILIETMQQEYNRHKTRRAANKALKKHKREGFA
jgi:hypothetical protein